VSQLPGPATSRREFARGDTLNLFAEVYDNVPTQQTHRVDVTTTLLSEDGREVFRSTQALAGNAKTGIKSSTFEYATAVPLKDASPGRYLLHVEAAVHGAGSVNGIQNSVRETLITVR